MGILTDKIKDQTGAEVVDIDLQDSINAGIQETAILPAFLTAKAVATKYVDSLPVRWKVLQGMLGKVSSGKTYDEKAKGNAMQDIRKSADVHKSTFELDQYVTIDPIAWSLEELKNIGFSEEGLKTMIQTTIGSTIGIHYDEYLFLKLLNVAKAKANGLIHAQDLTAKTNEEVFKLWIKDIMKLGMIIKYNSGNNGKAFKASFRRGIKPGSIRGVIGLAQAAQIEQYFIEKGIEYKSKEAEGVLTELSFLGATFIIYNEMTETFSINWLGWVSNAFATAIRGSEQRTDIRKIANEVFEMDSKATWGFYAEETDDYVVGSTYLADAAAVPAAPSFPVQ